MHRPSSVSKVLVILPRLEIGGGELVALEAIRGLVDRRIGVTLLVVIAGGPLAMAVPRVIELYSIVRASRSGLQQSPLRVASAVLARLPSLLRLTRDHDIILAVGEFGGSLYLGALLSQATGIPLIGWATGEVFKMTTVKGSAVWRSVIHRKLLRHCYPVARRILALSEHSKRDLTGNIPSIEGKIKIVCSPVPVDRVQRQARQPIPQVYRKWFDVPVIASLGRHEERKGFDILIRAHAVLRQRRVQQRLLIIGPEGPATVSLRDLIATLGVEESVILSGYVPNPFPLIRASTVFALASRSEGLGVALVEAMALGKPVVVSETAGGAVEVVGGGEYGIIVPGEDEVALADALERILRSPEEQAFWAKKAFERSLAFNVDRFIEQLICVMDEVRSECGRGG